MGLADAPARTVVKIVLIVVAVILCLYLIYLLRRPITWLFIAMFIAVALSPPVNFLNALHEARVRDRARVPGAASGWSSG